MAGRKRKGRRKWPAAWLGLLLAAAVLSCGRGAEAAGTAEEPDRIGAFGAAEAAGAEEPDRIGAFGAAEAQDAGEAAEALPAEEAAGQAAQEQGQAGTYLCEWGQDVSLKGLFDDTSLSVRTGDWAVEEASLELHLELSGLLDREVSYLGVSVDGLAVETVLLPEGSDRTAVYRTGLPVGAFGEGVHSVTVEAYLRGQSGDACVDESSISTWVNILADSRVELRYVPLNPVACIADFYDKFVSVEALEEGESMIAVPKGAADSSLTAAAHIIAGIAGNAEGDYEKITAAVVETKQDLKDASYILCAGRLDSLPGFLLEEMTQEQKEWAAGGALACLLDYGEAKILLVTGNDGGALKKAGDMLSNPEWIQGLTGKQERINGAADYRMEPYVYEEYIPLTEYGAQVRGNYEQGAVFSIYCPVNRRLADSAQLSLDYRYCAGIDFEKSMVTVLINDIPAGSRALTPEGADGTTEIFSIPAEINAAGSFSVEVRFLLYPKGDWCERTPEEIPWAYVDKTSMLKWTTAENTEVFFDSYPFPFIRNGAFSETVFLLPDQWGQEEFEMLAGVLLTMGGYLKSNAGGLEVSSADTPAAEGKNVIAVGTVKDNPVLQNGSGRTGEGGDAGVIRQLPERGCALLRLTEDAKTLHGELVITGETEADMLRTLAFLGDGSKLWQMKGDLFYTDGEEIDCRYIRTPAAAPPPPTVETLPGDDGENVPAVVVCSLLILLLLSGIMLLIKYGRYRDEK